MVKRRGLPSVGELVVSKISRINPNSAFAFLEEYNIEGMIHISEISSGWVRDIRNHIKVGQNAIAKVVRVDREHVSLSLKRVDDKQEKEKMKEYNLNKKAEKMLEIAANEMKISLDVAYEKVGFLLQENFGSLYNGFLKALKTPDILKERGVPEDWINILKVVAEKNIEQKEIEFKRKVIMKSYKPDGVKVVKNVLSEAKAMGIEIKYIAAPEYLFKYKTMDAKKGKREFLEKIDKTMKAANENGVENVVEEM